jgi:hypothetical protein
MTGAHIGQQVTAVAVKTGDPIPTGIDVRKNRLRYISASFRNELNRSIAIQIRIQIAQLDHPAGGLDAGRMAYHHVEPSAARIPNSVSGGHMTPLLFCYLSSLAAGILSRLYE